jgi:hypothetical protein
VVVKPQRRGWLSITAGEIYYTDGVVQGKHYGGGELRRIDLVIRGMFLTDQVIL